jgi:WXXGXW repeat (2 copies)
VRLPASLLLCWALLPACGATLGPDGVPSSSNAVTVDVVVSSPPPADKTDPARPPAPAFGYIWVAGHWDNLDGNYIWKSGRWVQGRPDYEYVRARYDFDSTRQVWVYHRPHWKRRHAASAAPTPPTPAPEPIVPPPAPVAPPADGGPV